MQSGRAALQLERLGGHGQRTHLREHDGPAQRDGYGEGVVQLTQLRLRCAEHHIGGRWTSQRRQRRCASQGLPMGT